MDADLEGLQGDGSHQLDGQPGDLQAGGRLVTLHGAGDEGGHRAPVLGRGVPGSRGVSGGLEAPVRQGQEQGGGVGGHGRAMMEEDPAGAAVRPAGPGRRI